MVKEKILTRLQNFERDNNVQVILAVESGSRAWGFASEDSDYDVRFVYKYQKEKYLMLEAVREDFEFMEGNIDYAGCDIRKWYHLLLGSNMNMIDWIFNENIYIDKLRNKENLKITIKSHFNRNTYIAHNYGLCKKNFHKYFVVPAENEPTAKRYVYCLRALLSARYCSENNTIAPINFWELLDKIDLPEQDKQEIKEMIEIKKKTKEKKYYRNVKWQEFIEQCLNGEHMKAEYDFDRKYYRDLLNQNMLNNM